LPLVTLNNKHFDRIANLTLVEWSWAESRKFLIFDKQVLNIICLKG
jgi:hypothetical protein